MISWISIGNAMRVSVIAATCLALGAFALWACDPVGEVCEPGASRSCSCGAGGAIGTQSCGDDGDGWEACDCPAGDGDGDLDADAVEDGDVDDGGDGDGDVDADAPPWEPTAGCTGGDTEERWLVVGIDGGGLLHGYVTGRDCAAPEHLCEGCLPTAISADGGRALVVVPSPEAWRLEDDLALVDLDDPAHPVDLLGIEGAAPAWIDDDSFYYLATSPLTPEPCEIGGVPERNDLRRHELSTGGDEVVAESLRRAWRGGTVVPSGSGRMVALTQDFRAACDEHELNVVVLDVDTGVDVVLPWTDSMAPDYTMGALLPGGDGYLVQQADRRSWTSRLYVVAFDGRAANVYPEVEGFGNDLLGAGRGTWPACATVRRLGPACELYCHGSESVLHRLTLDGAPPEVVGGCSALGETFQLMDVWQR